MSFILKKKEILNTHLLITQNQYITVLTLIKTICKILPNQSLKHPKQYCIRKYYN